MICLTDQLKKQQWASRECTTSPGFKTKWVWYTFYRASDWQLSYQHHKVEGLLVCVEGRGKISR